MFYTLLVVTFAIAVVCSFILTLVFRKPVRVILARIVPEEIARAWERYLAFAIYVVGISGGVRLWDLEKYITKRDKDTEIVVLTAERWVLEVYRTVMGTLQSVAWLLLVFFIVALIAYLIVRLMELKREPSQE